MVHITLFPMLNLLYFYTSIFRSICAVPKMTVSIIIIIIAPKLRAYVHLSTPNAVKF